MKQKNEKLCKNCKYVQYNFHATVSENWNLKLKFAYCVDCWLVSFLSAPYSLLVTAMNICKQKSGDFKVNKRKNNHIFCNWNKCLLKRDCWNGDRSNLFRYAKREENTSKSKLNWEKHHLPMSQIREPGWKIEVIYRFS